MKQKLEEIKRVCNLTLAEVVSEPMKLKELNKEISDLIIHHSPEYLVIIIEKDREIKKYKSTVYITYEDFMKFKP